jgi:hypothetical protein
MNTTTIYLSSTIVGGLSSRIHKYNEVTLKGNTHVEFDLTLLDESIYRVNIIKFQFGDGSEVETFVRPVVYNYKTQPITNEILYNKVGSICVPYTHVFTPSQTTYFQRLTCQCICYFNNMKFMTFNVPIRIAQNSFYDEVDELRIINTQLIPDSTSSTILIVDQQKSKFTNTMILST